MKKNIKTSLLMGISTSLLLLCTNVVLADKVIVIPLYSSSATASPAPVPNTGQTPTIPEQAPPGSDGALEKGITWPVPRFTDNSNGTVTDNLTGLTWLKNGNCTDTVGGINKSNGTLSWTDALTWSNNLANGSCNLSDASATGDWRLPNEKELQSLIALAFADPALSNSEGTAKWTSNDAFIGVQSDLYFSSSIAVDQMGGMIWSVNLRTGAVNINGMFGTTYYVWPVRN